jgi:hypothetical protein
MVGFAFSNAATSWSHILCWMGEVEGGAQSILNVTWPPLAAVVEPEDGLLEQAATVAVSTATAPSAP